MRHPWWRTYSPALFPTRLYPCIGCRSGGRTLLPSVLFFRNLGKCRKWPWPFTPRLCPSERGCLVSGWSGRSVWWVWKAGWVEILPEGSSRRESGRTFVGGQHEKPHLRRGFDPFGLQGGTRPRNPYPKVFHMPFLPGPPRFGDQGLGGT